MGIFTVERSVLFTPLSTAECRARLASRTAPWRSFERASGQVRGSVRGDRFMVAERRFCSLPRGAVLAGRLIPEAGGTRVVLQRLRSTPVWVDVLTGSAVGGIAGMAAHLVRADLGWPFLLLVVATIGAGTVMLLMLVHRWLGPKGDDALVSFVATTLDPATTPPAVPVGGRNDRRREEALFVALTTGTYLLILLLITGLFVVVARST